MANFAQLKAAIQQAVDWDNHNNEISGLDMLGILNTIINSLGAGYMFAGVAKLTPTQTDPGTPDQNVFYIASEPGTYTNFPISGGYLQVAENEVAIFKYNGQWSKETTGAATAAAVSQLGQQVIYDVTANNAGAKFASLSALLSSENLSTLIPVAVRCGGMSIRFVQSSNNKYVQYRLTSNTFTTTESEWQKQGAEVTVSQNTSTGHTEIHIGGDDYPIPSLNEMIIEITGIAEGTNVWRFSGIEFKTGVNYYIRKVSGDSAYLHLNDQTGPALNDRNWHTFTPESDGFAYFYVPNRTDAPVLMITTDKNYIFLYEEETKVKFSDIVNNLTEALPNKALDARQGKILKTLIDTNTSSLTDGIKQLLSRLLFTYIGEENDAQTAFFFNEIKVVQGEKYLVKLLAGLESKIATNANDGVTLSLNNWVEFTADSTAIPFCYVGSTVGKTPTKIIIANEKGVIGILTPLFNSVESIENCLNENKIKYQFAFNENVYLSKTATASYTEDGLGIEIPAGLSANSNFIGFRASAFDSTIDKFYGNTIHVKLVCELSGTDFNNLTINNKFETYNTNETISNAKATIKDKYLICEGDVTFASSGTAGYGTFYTGLRTGNCSYPVTVKFIGAYFELNDDIVQNFASADYLGELTYAIQALNKKVIDTKQDKVKTTTINVSLDGTSRTGRTIHYSGLNGIKKAIDSITDASETNRYIIHVEGIFCFTNPIQQIDGNDVLMYGGGEYSIIYMKDYVDIEGDGPNNSAIIMDFPSDATFHDGKVYSDYQPIYFFTGGNKISGMKIIGKNCRYAFHIEAGEGSQNKTIDIDNCEVEYQGHPDFSGGYGNCFGTGMMSGQVWNIANCILRYYDGNAFAVHTPLHLVNAVDIGIINFDNCTFIGNLNFSNYEVRNNVLVNIKDCSYRCGQAPIMSYNVIHDRTFSVLSNGITILVNGSRLKALYYCGDSDFNKGVTLKGGALRIKSLNTGATSIVRFDKDSSAFGAIIGDGVEQNDNKTIYGWDTNYGYVYRDGGVGISGQAFGTIDVDETGSNNVSLGKLLGDCSVTNKVLGVTIDGVDYTITFNENYTSQDNDYVLNKINAVIGSYGNADVFSPALLYYPNINGLTEVKCDDSNSILRGMGVVVTKAGVRRAKNSDGYIDGIALDDMAEGQYGRIITRGYIAQQPYRVSLYRAIYHTTMDNDNSEIFGDKTLGINPDNDGVFKVGQTPTLLRQVHLNYNSSADFSVFVIL